MRFEAIPYSVQVVTRPDGTEYQRSAFSSVLRSEDVRVEQRGFTVRDNEKGTQGFGRAPFANLEEAQAFAHRLALQHGEKVSKNA